MAPEINKYKDKRTNNEISNLIISLIKGAPQKTIRTILYTLIAYNKTEQT